MCLGLEEDQPWLGMAATHSSTLWTITERTTDVSEINLLIKERSLHSKLRIELLLGLHLRLSLLR